MNLHFSLVSPTLLRQSTGTGSSSTPIKKESPPTLESRLYLIAQAMFEILRSLVSSLVTGTLSYISILSAKLSVAMALKNSVAAPLPAALALILAWIAIKCSFVAADQFKNGAIDLRSNVSGLIKTP